MLAASWTAWRQHAAYSGSTKRMLCIAVARLQNNMLAKAWQSWCSSSAHNKYLKQRLAPVLGSKLRGIKWAATQYWAMWAHHKASLRVLLLQAQQARLLELVSGCFAAWCYKVQRKTGGHSAIRILFTITCIIAFEQDEHIAAHPCVYCCGKRNGQDLRVKRDGFAARPQDISARQPCQMTSSFCRAINAGLLLILRRHAVSLLVL